MTHASLPLLAFRAAFSSTLQKTKFHIAAPVVLILCGLLSSSCSSESTWTLHGNSLRGVESLTSSQPLNVHRLWLAIPSRYDHLETSNPQGAGIDRLISEEKTLEVQVQNSDLLLEISAYATGNGPLGRGDRGPLPLHLILQNEKFFVDAGCAQALGTLFDHALRDDFRVPVPLTEMALTNWPARLSTDTRVLRAAPGRFMADAAMRTVSVLKY